MELFRLPCTEDPAPAFEGQGLLVREMPLKKFPAGKHWHVKRADEPGTLEVTWSEGIVWAEERSNRRGEWVETAAKLIQEKLGSS